MAGGRHGGSRNGAGRPKKVHGLNIMRFFSTANQEEAAAADEDRAAPAPALPDVEEAIVTEEPPQKHGNEEDVLEHATTGTANTSNAGEPPWSDDTWYDVPLSAGSCHENGRTVSGIVKVQMDCLMRKKYKEKAHKMVKQGKLWDDPVFIRHEDIGDIKKSWPEFFKMRVFNWIPLDLLRNGWAPLCCNCGTKCAKNGTSNPPRLIFGQFENYLLNAPQRFICMKCKSVASREEANGVEKKQRTQYSWLSTHDDIMAQIKAENPSLVAAFPCHLSHINGVDNELLRQIVHLAARGLGPAAVAIMISEFHESRWQEKEVAWLCHLKGRLVRPAIRDGGTRIEQSEVEKCPEYFSSEICGAVPSSSYLTYTLCQYVESKRTYFDADVIKRFRSSRVVIIDASYKAGGRTMKHGKDKQYDTLHSGGNEYGELVIQKWSNGDSHCELRDNLKLLHEHGLSPELAFTDDPERDRQMFMDVFPKLRSGLNREAYARARTDAAGCGLNVVPSRGDCNYIYTVENAIAAIQVLLDELNECDDPGKKIVSIDAEWPVNIMDGARCPGKLNLLILTSEVIKDTYVIELYSMGRRIQELGNHLKRLFSNNKICFIGCCHKGDLTRLRNDYPDFDLPVIEDGRIIDIRQVAISRGIAKRGIGQTTLAALCQKGGFYLPKDNSVRVGPTFGCRNGELRHNTDALRYCHNDVEAPLLLYNMWKDKPILTKRLLTTDLRVGLSVDIMPASLEDTHPIAIGEVVQVTGRTISSINLDKGTSKRCLIKVTQVLNQNGIIHIPRNEDKSRVCACSRFQHGKIKDRCNFYRYKDFGQPVFNVVETVCRLRKSSTVVTTETQNDDTQTSTPPVTELLDPNESDGEHQHESNENVNVQIDEDGEEDTACSGIGNVPDFETEDNGDDTEIDFLQNVEISEDAEGRLDQAMIDTLEESNEITNVDDLDAALADAFADAEGLDDEEFHSSITDQQNDISPLAEEIVYHTPLEKLMADADKFAKQHYANLGGNNNGSLHECEWPIDDDNIMPQRDTYELLTRVLGDAFHVMDRVKVPMHHDFKAAYFRALRGAIFILNPQDVQNVKDVNNITMEKEWEKLVAFDFKYIAQRVRRRIPPPEMLFQRLKIVFAHFADKVDAKTNKPLFNASAKHKAALVLHLCKSGLLSDPPHYSFYVKRLDKNGNPMTDKKGLQLYRSVRGTNIIESLHQTISGTFNHTNAGAFYADSLLTLLRHQHNWRASLRNRPDFPKLRHYNGEAIDTVNELYEFCFGKPKYQSWFSTNDSLPNTAPGTSLFGITPIEIVSEHQHERCTNNIRNSSDYIALRQGSNIAYMPVKGKVENELFGELMRDAIKESQSLLSNNTFIQMARKWNEKALGKSNGIFKKGAIHLARRYKRWRKNKSRREAINNEESRNILKAVEQVTVIEKQSEGIDDLFNMDNDSSDEDGRSHREQPAEGRTATIQQIPLAATTNVPGKRKRKSCTNPGCADKFCNGPYGSDCTKDLADGKPRKPKRKTTKRIIRHCQLCGQQKCRGKNKRESCNKGGQET